MMTPYRYLKFFVAALLLCSFSASAQLATAIRGVVFNERTNIRSAQVSVSNMQNKATVMSDNLGLFSIRASVGDTLLFIKKGYAEQQVAVTSTQDLVVRMMPQQVLGPVVIRGTSKKEELQETMEGYRSKGIYYDGKPPALSALASPVTALYELFGKNASQARRFNNYMQRESKEQEIDKRYNKALVKRIGQFNDQDAELFMLAYRPSYEDLRKWTDYDLILFIKKSAESFKSIKEKPVQKLTDPS